ncbi:unnamed protein product [Cochlearia groenlandica]
MAILQRRILFLLFVTFLSSSLSLSFSPSDNYLVNCGSDVDSTVDNRRFIADASSESSSTVRFFSSEGSIALKGQDFSPNLPQIYRTARIFSRQAKYEFNVRNKGTHMVRLHFNRINSSEIDLNGDALFHVAVNGHVVLSNFNGGDVDLGTRVREFLIWVDSGEVVVRFVPSNDSKLAFVNAIEVISAPKDLIADVATSVSNDGTEKFNGLAKQAMEVLYRINVGGRKVTPFNDTLWRTWVTDDEFLKIGVDGSEKSYFSGRIKYRPGGASREVGPDNVYNTARVAKRGDGLVPKVDMSWDFPVSSGYKYLIRMHFCDIASRSLGMLYFNVYVNGNLAYQDFDISYASDYVLASPYYIDFVVDDSNNNNNMITVSVGPSNKTSAYEHVIDAMLNGVEIMKMNNSMGSLDRLVSTEMILSSCPNRRNLSIFITMMAFMCIFMSFYIVAQRKKVRNEYGWTKLHMDVREDNTKSVATRKA